MAVMLHGVQEATGSEINEIVECLVIALND